MVFVPNRSAGFLEPSEEKAVSFKRGTAFLFHALHVHQGSGTPKASFTGVNQPHLMALFAIELTQGPTPRFTNLHVSPAIKGPQISAQVRPC